MTNEKDLLKELLVDESYVQHNLVELVKQCKNIFQIQQENGQILFKNFHALTNPSRICALLTGKKFAKKLELITNDSMTITEIAKEFQIPSTTLSKPMSILVKKGFVLKNDKKYEITYNRLPEIIDEYFGDKK